MATMRCDECSVTAKNVAELVGRLRATSNLSTRFLQTKTALKTANVELAAAREAEQTARQAAELARREIDELKLQLRYDKSAAELQQLSETVTALRGEKEQLALKLEVAQSNIKQLRAAADNAFSSDKHEKLTESAAALEREVSQLKRKLATVEATRVKERDAFRAQLAVAKGTEKQLQQTIRAKNTELGQAQRLVAKLQQQRDEARAAASSTTSMPAHVAVTATTSVATATERVAPTPTTTVWPASLLDAPLRSGRVVGDISLCDGTTLADAARVAAASGTRGSDPPPDVEAQILGAASAAELRALFARSRVPVRGFPLSNHLSDIRASAAVVTPPRSASPASVTTTHTVLGLPDTPPGEDMPDMDMDDDNGEDDVEEKKKRVPGDDGDDDDDGDDGEEEEEEEEAAMVDVARHEPSSIRHGVGARQLHQQPTEAPTTKGAAVSIAKAVIAPRATSASKVSARRAVRRGADALFADLDDLAPVPTLDAPSSLGDVLVAGIPLRRFVAGARSGATSSNGAGVVGSSVAPQAMGVTANAHKRRRLTAPLPTHASTELEKGRDETVAAFVLRTAEVLLSRCELETVDKVVAVWAAELSCGDPDELCTALHTFVRQSQQLKAFESSSWSSHACSTSKEPWLDGEAHLARAIVAVAKGAMSMRRAAAEGSGGGDGDGGGRGRGGRGRGAALCDTLLEFFSFLLSSSREPLTTERGAWARVVRVFGAVCKALGRIDHAKAFCVDQLSPHRTFDPLLLLTFVGACPDALKVNDAVDLSAPMARIPTSADVAMLAIQLCVYSKLTASGRQSLAPAVAMDRLMQLCGWPGLPSGADASFVSRARADLVTATVAAMSLPRARGDQDRFEMPPDVTAEDAYWVLHLAAADAGTVATFTSVVKDKLVPLLKQAAAAAPGVVERPEGATPLDVSPERGVIPCASQSLMVATLWATGYFLRDALVAEDDAIDDGGGARDGDDGSGTAKEKRLKSIKAMQKMLLQTLCSDLPAAPRRAAALGLATRLGAHRDAAIETALRDWVASLATPKRAALPAALHPFMPEEREHVSVRVM